MKLYTLTIPENIAPGRLFPWLRRMLPQLPEYAVREALDRRDVKLNGKRVDRQAMLIPGAEVRLYKPLNGSKSFVGTLSGYSDGDVTLTCAGKELTFEKARIAQVRLRVL